MTDEIARETSPENVKAEAEAAAPPAKKPWKKPVLTVYPSTAANHGNTNVVDGVAFGFS